ncbi:hypothetical protein GZ998_05370 [Actinomyces sp. 594]|uniref:hypothetical protein n=1 Tax=Actinomyces sp. 594 TaxID=2057793 RepID=UPI001C58D2FB|nr:hypothetical protein [Actinomyces sp. 594]MBW3068942.1 hypothetical protein [Actinomyces sp. 594]
MLRPRQAPAAGVWAGTVAHRAKGLCQACYTRLLAEEAVEEPPAWRLTFCYRLSPDLSVVQQEAEAIAALVEHLHAIGAVLVRRPEQQPHTHKPGSALVFNCLVRDCTDVERRAIRALRDDVDGAAAAVGVAA